MSAASQLISEKAAAIVSSAQEFLSSVNAVVEITNNEQCEGAMSLVVQLKSKKKELENSRDEEKTAYYEPYKKVLDTYNPLISLLEEKAKALDLAYRKYKARLEAEAAERQRIANIAAERARQEAERKAEEARRKAEAAAEAGKDTRAADYAIKAQILTAQAESIVAPIVQNNVPQNVRGAFNTRITYKARVVDMAKFYAYVVSSRKYNLAPPDQKLLDSTARAMKDTMDIPGVEVYKSE